MTSTPDTSMPLALDAASSGSGTPGPRPASRPRKARSSAPAPVHLVMRTSRFQGSDGRAVARGRVALCDAFRAKHLIGRGEARLARVDEITQAQCQGVVAQLI